MFINESTCGYNFSRTNKQVPANAESAFAINYEITEEYHNLVESMMMAEHTAIINEDANLLCEAENAFFKKIQGLWKKLVEWVQKMWNNLKAWFISKTKSAQEFLKKYESQIRSAIAEKGSITVKGFLYAADPFDVTKPMLDSAKNELNKMIAEAGKIGGIMNGKQINSLSNNYTDALIERIFGKDFVNNKKKFKDLLEEKIRGGKKADQDIKIDASTVNSMINFIKKLNISNAEKEYKAVENMYRRLEKLFSDASKQIEKSDKVTQYRQDDKLSYTQNVSNSMANSSLKGSLASVYGKMSAACKRVADGINIILGIASSISKERENFYVRALRTVMSSKGKKQEDKEENSNIGESSILDLFAI